MKVLFVYPAIIETYPLQIAALLAYLKKFKHEVKCMFLDIRKGFDSSHLAEAERAIRDYQPGLIAFSCYEPGFEINTEIAAFIKSKFTTPIIFGGYYPSIAPEEVIKCEAADFVCRGEGEEPLLELCNALEAGKDCSAIRNIWVRRNGEVVRNPMRPLIENLDTLPYIDRDITDYQAYMSKGEIGERKLVTLVGRGCPYHCTYCIDPSMREIYPNKNKYYRMRSVDHVIGEIQELRKRFDFNVIGFNDENLTANVKWLEEFCKRYKEEVGMPFFCASRVETCTEKNVKMLKDAGCYLIHFGVECGDEGFRKKHLKRTMSNNDIIKAFRLAKKYGINVWSYVMVGMPYETRWLLFKTIVLNFRLLPAITMSSFYYPLHGTEMGDICYKNGWVDFEKKKRVLSIADDTVLKHPNLTVTEIKIAKWVNVASACTNRFFWRSFASRIVAPFRNSAK